LTLSSGGSGGVFAPSLYTGAMLGDAFGRVAHTLFPTWTANAAAYGLVGMAAVFAATSEAPITAITIVFEMSNDYTIILPLMIAVVIATLLGRRLIGGTIDSIALTRRGIDWDAMRATRPLTRVRVSMVEHSPPVVASPDDLLRDVAAKLEDTPEFVVPVCRDGRFLGVVLASDTAAEVVAKPLSTVAHCMRAVPATLSRSDTLEQAAVAMADPDVPLLPIVESVTGKLLGIVTRRDVLNAYRDRVSV
jgi:CIC family chloride channel protein